MPPAGLTKHLARAATDDQYVAVVAKAREEKDAKDAETKS